MKGMDLENLEWMEGLEPSYADLQSAASPFRHTHINRNL